MPGLLRGGRDEFAIDTWFRDAPFYFQNVVDAVRVAHPQACTYRHET